MSRIRADLKKTVIQPVDKPLPKKKPSKRTRITFFPRDHQRMLNWLDQKLETNGNTCHIKDDITFEELFAKGKEEKVINEGTALITFRKYVRAHFGKMIKAPKSGFGTFSKEEVATAFKVLFTMAKEAQEAKGKQ